MQPGVEFKTNLKTKIKEAKLCAPAGFREIIKAVRR